MKKIILILIVSIFFIYGFSQSTDKKAVQQFTQKLVGPDGSSVTKIYPDTLLNPAETREMITSAIDAYAIIDSANSDSAKWADKADSANWASSDSSWISTRMDTLHLGNGRAYNYYDFNGGDPYDLIYFNDSTGVSGIQFGRNAGSGYFSAIGGDIDNESNFSKGGILGLDTTASYLEHVSGILNLRLTLNKLKGLFLTKNLQEDTLASIDTNGLMKVNSLSIGGSPAADTTYNMDSINFPYTIFFQATSSDPNDGETVYFCSTPQAPATNENNRAVIVIQNGTIRLANIIMNTTAGNAGSNENISLYIRKNRITDYLIQTIGSTSNVRIFHNYNLSIPVAQGDILEMKVVPGTWATNPTNVHWSGNILIR